MTPISSLLPSSPVSQTGTSASPEPKVPYRCFITTITNHFWH